MIVDEYRAAVKSTIAKQRQVERIKGGSTIKRDRADDALDELDEAQKTEQVLSQRVQAISQKLAPSVRGHTQQMHRDLLQVLAEHANAGLSYEKQFLRELEALSPELRGIPARGQAEVTYKHVAASPSPSLSASSHSRPTPASPQAPPITGAPAWGSPVPQSPLGRSPSLSSTRTPGFGTGTQSMLVPPTHGGALSRSTTTGGRVADLARSVQVVPSADVLKGRPGEKVVDERQRVDARMAASKLANMF